MEASTAIAKRDQAAQAIAHSLSDLQSLGEIFVRSGFFSDSRDAAQAIVKVMAGQELGFPPIASMTGVYIVKGKVSLSANLIAAAIKRSGRYNYRVRKLDDDGCSIDFFEGKEQIGNSSFSREDAVKAGLLTDNYKKFPRNMFFARTLSNGAKWFCPDIFGGPVYTPDELGATVDAETGEVIDAEPEKPAPVTSESRQNAPKPAPQGKPAPQPENATTPNYGEKATAFIALCREIAAEGITSQEISDEIKNQNRGDDLKKILAGDPRVAEASCEAMTPHFASWLATLRSSKAEPAQEAA